MNLKRQVSFYCEQYQSAYNVLENSTQESPRPMEKIIENIYIDMN